MKYDISGVSTPFGGVSWNKKITAKDRFEYLLLYFESKRILTNPSYMELKDECISSVLEIRRTIVDMAKDVTFSDKDLDIIRKLINACNDYLNTVNKKDIPHLIYKNEDMWADESFDKSMKKFRFNFRDEISQIEKNIILNLVKIYLINIREGIKNG